VLVAGLRIVKINYLYILFIITLDDLLILSK